MSIKCEVILSWDATPAERRSLGLAFWNWSTRAAGGRCIHQYLPNQALADLVAGRLPAHRDSTAEDPLPYVFFTVPGDATRDRGAMLASRQLAIPCDGIAGVRIGGVRWRPAESDGGARSGHADTTA